MRSLPTHRLRGLVPPRVRDLIELVLQKPWPARVQRIGMQALRRVAARFPLLAELIGQAGKQGASGAAHGRVRDAPTNASSLSEAAWQALEGELADSSWQVRAHAVAHLPSVIHPGVEHALRSALHDESAEVAANAALALAKLGGAGAAVALREVLQNPTGYYSPVTRAAAVRGLARFASEADLALEAVYDVDAEVSLAAVAALAEFMPERAVARLTQALGDRSGYLLSIVRLAAANALARSGRLDPHTAAKLLPTEQDPEVRRVLEQAATADAAIRRELH